MKVPMLRLDAAKRRCWQPGSCSPTYSIFPFSLSPSASSVQPIVFFSPRKIQAVREPQCKRSLPLAWPNFEHCQPCTWILLSVPSLVLSFMGDQKGRIIQASYNGKGLTLQYSRLWSFANSSTAPLELFIRYRLSEPIGGVRTLSIR